jgi:hypothetical protein
VTSATVRDRFRVLDQGGPVAQRVLRELPRPAVGQHLLQRDLGRDLVVTERPADGLADEVHLLFLGHRGGPGENQGGGRRHVPGQGLGGHGRDVALMDQ